MAQAHCAKDYDQAFEFEAMGGDLLELSKDRWTRCLRLLEHQNYERSGARKRFWRLFALSTRRAQQKSPLARGCQAGS